MAVRPGGRSNRQFGIARAARARPGSSADLSRVRTVSAPPTDRIGRVCAEGAPPRYSRIRPGSDRAAVDAGRSGVAVEMRQEGDVAVSEPRMDPGRKSLLSARQIGVAAAFGGAALAVVLAGLTIPVPGTPVVTDPREVFTTTGAALTGPIGGIVIGLLAGIAEPGIPLASLLAHIIGALWSGWAYKNLSWRFRQNNGTRLALWVVQVVVYYVVFVVPLFSLGVILFYPDPANGSFFGLLATLEAGVVPEMIFTSVVTTIIMASLPERFRRPLW